MIKINLLHSLSVEAKESVEIDNVLGSADVLQSSDLRQVQKEALKNLFIILFGAIAFYVYEQHNISELNKKRNYIQDQLFTKVQKNTQAAQAVQQIDKLKKEQELLQNQIASIENLKKDRNRILRILELFQKQTPPNFWFSDLSFDQNSVSFSGYAVSDSEVTSLLEVLNKSVYFQDVNLIKSADEKHQRFGLLKKVSIRCLLETKL